MTFFTYSTRSRAPLVRHLWQSAEWRRWWGLDGYGCRGLTEQTSEEVDSIGETVIPQLRTQADQVPSFASLSCRGAFQSDHRIQAFLQLEPAPAVGLLQLEPAPAVGWQRRRFDLRLCEASSRRLAWISKAACSDKQDFPGSIGTPGFLVGALDPVAVIPRSAQES